MDPVTAVVIAVIVAIAAGFGAGWGLKPDGTAKALEAQAETIEALQEGQAAILAEASKPVVIDAELRSTLAEVPVQCRADAGGDPTSIFCTWASCNAYSQSAANRPECSEITKAIVAHHRAEDERAEAH